jgi:hypothetical protein
MTQVARQTRLIHWRDRAIQRSEGISDAWEVVKAYSARFAEWILFACMVANIIQMLPGVKVLPWVEATVMGIQVVTLDVAGFGLASMGAAARRAGNNAVATTAEKTGKWLIALMIVTLLVVAIGVLFPTTKGVIDYIEKGLILVRVVMTVVYGHVMHALREAGIEHVNQMEDLRAENERLEKALTDEQQAAKEQVEQLESAHEATVSDLQEQLEGARAESDQLAKKLATVQESLRDTLQNGSSIQSSMTEVIADRNEKDALVQSLQRQLSLAKNDLQTKIAELSQARNSLAIASQNESSLQAKIDNAVEVAREEMKAQMQVELDELRRTNKQLKDQAKASGKAPVKPTKQVSSGKFDARQFVYACLQKNPEMKLSEIVQLAKLQGQELSEPTISRYRKEYRESSSVRENESSAM